MEEEKKQGRLERIETMLEEIQIDKKKVKKFKLPMKAKVNKRRMKEGYVTVVVIEDNKNIDFVKEPIIDGTIKLVDTFHALDSKDVFFYKNKPMIFQTKRGLNPHNPLENKDNPLEIEHETYGQKYVMARMEGDKIITRKKMGIGLVVGVLIIIGLIGYVFFGG